ncbi:MAG TPA: DUF3820 family protein [Planctomycetaceae bacterium]|jgi:hypothetical protein|nr:DUF3820 family protein [Planctomycetaceae bacterium]
MKMPLKKYRGWEVDDVPKGYLYWITQQEWVFPWLRTAAQRVLNGLPADNTTPNERVDEAIDRIVTSFEEQLAQQGGG